MFLQEIMEKVGVSVVNRSQRNGVIPSMKGRKLKLVYWQRTLEEKKGVKQVEG